MEQKSLPEQVVALTDGIIDIEQAELLIRKIRIAYDYPTQWLASTPGINTGRNQGLSKMQLISVWKLVEQAIQQAEELLPEADRKVILPINISARIQGNILLNATMDFEISRRLQKADS